MTIESDIESDTDTKISSDSKTSSDTKTNSVNINDIKTSEVNMSEEKGERSKNDYPLRNTIPIPNIEDFVDFNCWVDCVEAWSETTELPKSKQGYSLASEIPVSSKRYGATLREDLFKEVKPSTLANNDEGVNLIIEFLKTRFWQDSDEEIYSTYAEVKSIKRKKGQTIMDYIIEYDKMLKRARQLEIANTNDRVLAMDLMITADLTDTEFILLRTVADIRSNDKKRYETVKQKMREIFGKLENSKSTNNEIFHNEAKNEDDIDEIYLSKGWKPPNKKFQYQKGPKQYQKYNKYKQNQYPANNNDKTFRTRKVNPNGPDGNPLKCKGCKAITHLLKDCPDSYEKINKMNNKKFQTVYMVDEKTKEEKEILLPISDTESEEEEGVYCAIYCTDNKEDLSTFTAEALNKGALDTCCTSNVCGEKWLKIYLDSLPIDLKSKVQGPKSSKRLFMFGNQGKMKAKANYSIPVRIGGDENSIEVDVIQSDIPLLLSKNEMKNLGIALDIKNDKGYINNKPLILTTTSAGHYVVDLLNEPEELEEVNITELENDDHTVQMKALIKIHRQFGHRNKTQFVTILKEAGQWKEKFSGMIDQMMDRCEGCILRKRTPDRPAVAPPMANDFGQVLGMDLKIWDKNKGIYILYMIDCFTRFQVASVIRSKEPSEVIKAFTLKWLPTFGRIEKIMTDNGTEFCNQEMQEVAAALDVIHVTTGANSPWQNGLVEKNHHSTDTIIHSVLRDYPNMKLEVALAWAVSAVNAMTTVRGFSPFQLVFGRQIKLPNILEDPPAAWEEPQKSKTLMETLQAMHATRVAYTKNERCERIRKALKAKIRCADTIYEKGDIVYFKKEAEPSWRGPAKVVFQDSKVIFVRMGSVYYRVSANRLLKAGEGLAKDIKAQENEPSDKEIPAQEKEDIPNIQTRSRTVTTVELEEPDWNRLKITENNEKDSVDVEQTNKDMLNEIEESEEITPTTEPNQIQTTVPISQGKKRKKTNQKPEPELNDDGTIVNAARVLKKNDRIEIFENGKWEKGLILGHGGKVGGVNGGWYNIKLDNGQVFNDEVTRREIRYENQQEEEEEVFLMIKLDIGKNIILKSNETRKIRYENEEDSLALLIEEEVLAVMVPREQRDSPAAMAAKFIELDKLKAFDTYTIVDDEGQEKITTVWVLTEKGSEIRARLTARGFQEEGNFRTDSPTVQKHSVRLLLAIAVHFGWDICTTDISSAFLQGNQMDRLVFIKPPKEANLPGKLWKLNKCLYGLKDASRKWYFKVVNKLEELGFQKSFSDSGVFYLIKDNKLIGFVALHVDDFLHAGSPYFNKEIMTKLLEDFKVGKSEAREFLYTGIRIQQHENYIKADQDKYIRNVQIPNIDLKELKDKKREMNQEELTLLRQLTGIVNWAQRATRPDLSFETIELSTKFKGGKVEDLLQAKNVANRLKKLEISVVTSDIGCFDDCQVWIFTDAAFRNLNNNTDSCGGYFLLIVNTKSGKCAPIEWRSGKLKRKVHSTLGAETLALYTGIDAALAVKQMLKEMTGGVVDLGVKAITDNRSARDAVYSESEVGERMLRADIAMIKDMVKDQRITEIKWVAGKSMLADILTKKSVNKIPIMEVLENGRISEEMLQLVNN